MSVSSLDVAIGTYRINVINRIENDDVEGACHLLLNMNALLNKHKRVTFASLPTVKGLYSDIFLRQQKQWLRLSLMQFEEAYFKELKLKNRFGDMDAIIEFYRKSIISRRDHRELLDACYLQATQVKMLPDTYLKNFKPVPTKGPKLESIYNKELERWLIETSRKFELAYQHWKELVRSQYQH